MEKRKQKVLNSQVMKVFAEFHTVWQFNLFLDQEALLIVPHGHFLNGYCNVLDMGLPLKSIQKLQLVQKVAAQAVMCTLGSVHITFLLCKLHWLALCFWIQFKMLIMTYNILHDMILDYFSIASP